MPEPMSPLTPPAPPLILVRDGASLPASLDRPVIAIGNFDGLHRGHRAVMEAAMTLARRLQRPAAVVTFDPHPRAFFRPDAPVFRLTPEPLKASILARWGLDGMVILPFNAQMAATSAADFVQKILIDRLNVSGVVVGHDFHFGRGREGSPDFIAAMCRSAGIPVEIVAPLREGEVPVSSSAIRAALAEGDIATATRLLGHPFLLRGEVVHGEKIGRTLGYPTANIRLGADCGLKHGIYAVRIAIDGVVHPAVASYGRRPTFDNGAPLFEIFVFDFSGDLYGKTVDVDLAAYLRGEMKFDSVDALITQMDRDSLEARALLAHPADLTAPSLLPLALG